MKRKRILLITSIAALAVAGVAYALVRVQTMPSETVAVADPATVRITAQGAVVGTHDGPSLAWLGIPYAHAERWRAPAPPTSWTGTRPAIRPGALCPQFQRSGFGAEQMGVPREHWGELIGSEDCLNLNVRTPPLSGTQIASGEARLPVMMYLHGGGNAIGHGELYNYTRFVAKERVIVVTINHRLGPLGWFAHDALDTAGVSDLDKSGNYAVLDMIQALRWIHENIASFGGDPNNITVFGLSSGGSNVAALLVSPLAKGLFHKAIIESGVLWHETVAQAQNYRDGPDPGQRHSSRELVNQLLVADGRAPNRAAARALQDSMDRKALAEYLRNEPLTTLMAPLRPDNASGMYDTPNLILDGVVLPKQPFFDRFADAATFNTMPMLLGSNRDEAKFYMLMDPRLARTTLRYFRRPKEPDLYQRVAYYRSESWRATTVSEFAQRVSGAQQAPVYVYRFDWDELARSMFVDLQSMLGAGHSLETAFVSGQFENFLGIKFLFQGTPNVATRDELSTQMMSYWAQFAYAGSPGKGRDGTLPEWRPWKPAAARGEFIVFDTPSAGGLRMTDEPADNAEIKRQLATDRALPQAERCRLYVQMYYVVPINAPWDQHEFDSLGPDGCRDYDPKRIFWEEHAFNVGSDPTADTFH